MYNEKLLLVTITCLIISIGEGLQKRQLPPRPPGPGRNGTGASDTSPPMQSSLQTNCTPGSGLFPCRDGSGCVDENLVCDHRRDCPDRSDEIGCHQASETCFSWQLSCQNGSCSNTSFQCNNGKCINIGFACNRRDNCGDRSDEQRAIPGLKCIFGSLTDTCVLPQRYVNRSGERPICRDDSDICVNRNGEFDCFECLDRRLIISQRQLCDGVFDCNDLSDECLCENSTVPSICSNICLGGNGNDCRKGSFMCGDNLEYEARITDICDRKLNCPNGVDEQFCRKFASNNVIECAGNQRNDMNLTAYVCDGRPECYDYSDECGAGCDVEAPFCELQSRLESSDRLVVACDNRFDLIVQSVCDGLWSPCEPRIESEEIGCESRFYCDSSMSVFISIDKSLQCNGYTDCEDGSDELECDRFYCESGQRPVSVPNSFVFDDFRDCMDGSDECPMSLDGNSISSRNELIANTFLRAWLWFMAIVGIIGNVYVIVKTISKYKKLNASSPIAKVNHFLIFNLAIADILMAFYLIILASYSAIYSGSYCFVDELWRTGTMCGVMGALSVIASEASVLVLTVLTGVRLYAVFCPLNSRNIKILHILPAVIIAWALAITLAVLPLSRLLFEVVTEGAWLPSKFFTTTMVTRGEAMRFSDAVGVLTPNITKLVTRPNQDLPWTEIIDFLRTNNPGNSIRGLFGFYSLNSVCLSKLFVTRQVPGWEFTITVISLNLILFVFVAGAYFAIYKRSASSITSSVKKDRNSRMQYKIIKLVATDFACWIPICIMAFIHFSGVADLNNSLAYVITAVVLLPINSVLNPLLYSNTFEKMWAKSDCARTWICKMLHCMSASKNEKRINQADVQIKTIDNTTETDSKVMANSNLTSI